MSSTGCWWPWHCCIVATPYSLLKSIVSSFLELSFYHSRTTNRPRPPPPHPSPVIQPPTVSSVPTATPACRQAPHWHRRHNKTPTCVTIPPFLSTYTHNLRSASFIGQAVIMTLARQSSDSSRSSLSLPGWRSAFKCSMVTNEDGHRPTSHPPGICANKTRANPNWKAWIITHV